MTTNEILDWLPHLAESPYFKDRDGRKMLGAERRTVALNDPALGWNVAMAQAREKGAADDPTPICILLGGYTEVLSAYHYLRAKQARQETPIGCEAMESVDSLLDPRNVGQRAVLNALLISPNAPFNRIAEWMTLSEEVVLCYSRLVFNVRDRLEDYSFINQMLFPKGRTSRSGNDATIPHELKLLRAGREKGGEEVLYQAGYAVEETEGKSPQQQLQTLESALVASAMTDLRLGDPDSPALKQVRPLLAAHAENRDANHGVLDDTKAGLGAIGLGRGILDTVKRIQGPDIAKRLHMPTQEEIAASKKKFSPAPA